MDIFVARQPIFDVDNNVVAYELLYRNGLENSFERSIAGNVATSILLINTYLSFGMEKLVEGKKAFVNFDKHLIMSGVAELLDKDKVVIELLEDIVPNAQFIEKIVDLRAKGYTCAIDDYVDGYKYQKLVECCNIIKVDFMHNSKEELIRLTKELRKQHKFLLAEKIETKEEFEWAKSIGYEYFQGFYFSKPLMETRKTFSDSALQYIKLMNELMNVEPDIGAISKIIEIDVSLTYKLLKLVNSSLGLSHEIVSVQHAIALLGLKSFSQWLSLAMVQNIGETEVNELAKYALTRSYMMDKISGLTRFDMFRDEMVLIGILSVVDAMLEMKMSDVLEPLPVSDGVRDTLLGEITMFSDCFNMIVAYEKGEFEEADRCADLVGYPKRLLAEHYIEAIRYADTMYEELNRDNALV